MRPIDDVAEDLARRTRDDVAVDGANDERGSNEPPDGASDFSHFAYHSPRTFQHVSRVHPTSSRPTHVARRVPLDSRLAQLSKCIGCGLRWTRKKTAKQKHTHIEHCAKKNALSADTVRVLIQNEIATSSPANTPDENAITTLMGSVVRTGPVKTFRRQQVTPTVRSLSETREGILHRARDILGPTEGQVELLPTQQFGQSALAHRNSRQPRCPALLDVDGSIRELPSTQPLGESSLRGGNTTSERSVDGCSEPSLPPSRFASLFAQGSVLSGDRYKRPVSPPLEGSVSGIVKRRLLQ